MVGGYRPRRFRACIMWDAKPRKLPVAPTSLRTARCLTRLGLPTVIRDWNLFLVFDIVAGCTKVRATPLRWLFDQIAGKVESKFAEAGIL
jgi:hypothetical protein